MDPGDVVADRFEIEELAGSGGGSAVYRARDNTTGEAVALKVLRVGDTLQVERFAREAQVLATLEHPAIVRYVSHGSTPRGEPFLAMEWLEGESLARRLGRGPLRIDETVALGVRVCGALSVAHRRGIVHRDLKPGNLFLAGYSVEAPTLLDFGVAHLTGAHRIITQTGVILGTPGYMAPEQARGERNIDARADVFSLGCVLFRCLTGVDAFPGDDALAAMLKVVLEEARSVSELRASVPEPLDRLVARLLQKNPSDRPPDATSLLDELRALEADPGHAPALSERPAALTANEWRLTCVLLARPAQRSASVRPPLPDPGRPREAAKRVEALTPLVESYEGRIELLADGSILVRLANRGTALDQAARGAQCALALAKALPDVSVVL